MGQAEAIGPMADVIAHVEPFLGGNS